MLMIPGSWIPFLCKPLDNLYHIQTFRRLLNYHCTTREEEREYLALGKINAKTVLQGAQHCLRVGCFSESQGLRHARGLFGEESSSRSYITISLCKGVCSLLYKTRFIRSFHVSRELIYLHIHWPRRLLTAWRDTAEQFRMWVGGKGVPSHHSQLKQHQGM